MIEEFEACGSSARTKRLMAVAAATIEKGATA